VGRRLNRVAGIVVEVGVSASSCLLYRLPPFPQRTRKNGAPLSYVSSNVAGWNGWASPRLEFRRRLVCFIASHPSAENAEEWGTLSCVSFKVAGWNGWPSPRLEFRRRLVCFIASHPSAENAEEWGTLSYVSFKVAGWNGWAAARLEFGRLLVCLVASHPPQRTRKGGAPLSYVSFKVAGWTGWATWRDEASGARCWSGGARLRGIVPSGGFCRGCRDRSGGWWSAGKPRWAGRTRRRVGRCGLPGRRYLWGCR
jgi:hypothetical protein